MTKPLLISIQIVSKHLQSYSLRPLSLFLQCPCSPEEKFFYFLKMSIPLFSLKIAFTVILFSNLKGTTFHLQKTWKIQKSRKKKRSHISNISYHFNECPSSIFFSIHVSIIYKRSTLTFEKICDKNSKKEYQITLFQSLKHLKFNTHDNSMRYVLFSLFYRQGN